MVYSWTISVDGQTFEEMNLRDRVTEFSVSHQVPKAAKKKKKKKSKSNKETSSGRRGGHEASVTLVNHDQKLTKFFRTLDKVKIWLGLNGEQFYQGTFRITKVSHSGNESQRPTVTLSFGCKSFDAVRQMKTRVWNAHTVLMVLESIASDYGWDLSVDEDIAAATSVVNLAKSAYVSDWDFLNQLGEDLGDMDVLLTYPAKVKLREEATPTLKIVKERYEAATSPDGRPIKLYYGQYSDPNGYYIQSYETSSDVKEPKATKGGDVDKTGAKKGEEKKDDTWGLKGPPRYGSTGEVIFEEDPAAAVENSDGSSGGVAEMQPSGPISSKDTKNLTTKVNVAIENSKKTELNITLAHPMPFLTIQSQVELYGILGFEGVWDVKTVKHGFSGTAFLRTEMTLNKKIAGVPKKKDDTGKKQDPREGDDTWELKFKARSASAVFQNEPPSAPSPNEVRRTN